MRSLSFLASGFHNSELTFDFCADIVNDLCGIVMDARYNDRPPDLFWQVYLAFDEGEFFHDAYPHLEDPIEAFTRPLIARIIDACK